MTFSIVVVFGGGYLLNRLTGRQYFWPIGIALGAALGSDVHQRVFEWIGKHQLLGGLAFLLLGIGMITGFVAFAWVYVRSFSSIDKPGNEGLVSLLVMIAMIFYGFVGTQFRIGPNWFAISLGAYLSVVGITMLMTPTGLSPTDSLALGALMTTVGVSAIFRRLLPVEDEPWLQTVVAIFLLGTAIAWLPSNLLYSGLALCFACTSIPRYFFDAQAPDLGTETA